MHNMFETWIVQWCTVMPDQLPAREFFRLLKGMADSDPALSVKNGLKDVIDALAAVITKEEFDPVVENTDRTHDG